MRILQTQTDTDADSSTSNSNSTDTEQASNSTTDGDRNGATPLHSGGPRHDGDFVNGTYIDNDGDNGMGVLIRMADFLLRLLPASEAVCCSC